MFSKWGFQNIFQNMITKIWFPEHVFEKEISELKLNFKRQDSRIDFYTSKFIMEYQFQKSILQFQNLF